MTISLITVFIVTYALFSVSGFLFPVNRKWCDKLKKPSWTPSGHVIGMIRTVWYALISWSAALVYAKTSGFQEISTAWLALLLVNYVSNCRLFVLDDCADEQKIATLCPLAWTTSSAAEPAF